MRFTADGPFVMGDSLPKLEWHTNGCFYDLSNVFNSSNNRPGQVVTLPEKSGWIGVNATCPAGTTVNYTYRSYVTELPVQSTENGFQYLKLNDYLLGAMSITDSSAGLFYPRVIISVWELTPTYLSSSLLA